MKNVMLWSIVGSLAASLAAYGGEGFETPTYQDGQSINQVNGWTVDGTAAVTKDQSAEGSQSLSISGSSKLTRPLQVPGVRFIDLQVLPYFVEEGQPAEALKIGGAKLKFVKSGTGGQIAVVSGTGSQGTPVGKPIPVESDNVASDWMRLTVREDTAKGTWDLFVNGVPIVFDQAGTKNSTTFQVENATEAPFYLDSYSEAADNPLFEDSDGDGMPDAYEVANDLNPKINDRDADLDGDGISNIREMFAGTSPRIAANGPALGSILYVDNMNGNDSNNGKSSYLVNGDGPKASIKGAMSAAQSGDMIVIMRGTGLYQEGSRGPGGKRLSLRAVENITIK